MESQRLPPTSRILLSVHKTEWLSSSHVGRKVPAFRRAWMGNEGYDNVIRTEGAYEGARNVENHRHDDYEPFAAWRS
jgi:hypothetical protein